MMKQMTIKKKVTLWYTGIIALILGMVLVFMFYFVDKVGISATEEEVSTAVTGFSANFQFQDETDDLKVSYTESHYIWQQQMDGI